MSSKKNERDLWDFDLERDNPLTAADLEALAQARRLRPLSPEAYQAWVDLIEKHHGKPPHLDNTDADEPFTL
jgi:hypothetical protein